MTKKNFTRMFFFSGKFFTYWTTSSMATWMMMMIFIFYHDKIIIQINIESTRQTTIIDHSMDSLTLLFFSRFFSMIKSMEEMKMSKIDKKNIFFASINPFILLKTIAVFFLFVCFLFSCHQSYQKRWKWFSGWKK